MLRALALVATALVMALTVFAASPGLHARLHGVEAGGAHDGAHKHSLPLDDTGCPIALFAQGFSLPVAAPQVLPPTSAIPADQWKSAEVLLLVAARFRLPPERGPPVG